MNAAQLRRLVTPPPVVSSTLKSASGVRIHALNTGWLCLKTAHRSLRAPAALRFPAILADPCWTPPLPMFAWAIEHPEGLIVIDCGEVAPASSPATYLAGDPGTAWFVVRNFCLWTRAEHETGPQLQRLGLDPRDTRTLVQTHLHFDHTGGLHFFQGARVLTAQRELARLPNGAAPSLWPAWYRPEAVTYRRERFGPFPESLPLTRAGDLRLIPTPGHTAGHQSVVFDDGEVLYLFAGDAAFDQGQLLRGAVAGIVADVPSARASLTRLRRLAAQRPCVLLPTHDPQAGERLAGRVTVPSGA